MTGKHCGAIAVCLTAIVVLSVTGCRSEPGEAPPAEVSDIDLLQGTWIGTAVGEQQGQWTMIISGTTIDFKGPGPEAYTGTLKLNPDVDPKQADFVIDKCAVDQYVGTTALTIYKIEGDKFTMAGNEPGSTIRPTQFESGNGTRLFVLTKQ